MDGYDYDVWYRGQIIANVKAFSDKAALKLAQQIYGPNVSVARS